MPPPRKVDLLPDNDRAWLDAELVRRGFADYHALSDLLAERGFEISHSALGQHGLALKKKLAAIRASTEAAKLITDNARDDEDRRSEAVMSLVQTELFNVLVNLQEAADADEGDDSAERIALLAKAAKAISELSRASVNQKKMGSGCPAKTGHAGTRGRRPRQRTRCRNTAPRAPGCVWPRRVRPAVRV